MNKDILNILLEMDQSEKDEIDAYHKMADGPEKKKAFKKLARKYHPDMGASDDEGFKYLNSDARNRSSFKFSGKTSAKKADAEQGKKKSDVQEAKTAGKKAARTEKIKQNFIPVQRTNAENAAKNAEPTPPSVKAAAPTSLGKEAAPTPPSPPSPPSPSNPIKRTPGGNKYPAYTGTGKKNNKAIKIAGGIAAGTAAVTGAVIAGKKIKEHREYKKWLASHKKTKEQVPFNVWKSKYAVKAVAESFEYDILNENISNFINGSLDALCENETITDNFELGMVSYYIEEFIERDINYLEAYYEAFLEEFDNLTEYENSYEAYCEGYYLALQ
jgi:hypothetical protein